jgi:hypothetical protein
MSTRLVLVILGAALVGGCDAGVTGAAATGAAATGTSVAPEPGSPGTSTRATPNATRDALAIGMPGAGVIVFDRYDVAIGAEGPYLGSAMLDPDGVERPIAVPERTGALIPVPSPDGSQVLVVIFSFDGPVGPAIMQADGTAFHFVMPHPIDGFACSDWAPDASTLVCSNTGNDDAAYGIYTVRADGTGVRRLTVSPFQFVSGPAGDCGGGENRAVYSPDGSRIAFVRQKCGEGRNPSADESASIVVIKADGSDPVEIVPQGQVKSHPGGHISWSADDLIAFGSQDGELFTVRPDGTDVRRIDLGAELGGYHAYGPDWSPDGKRIVFSMYLDRLDSTDLYTVAPDGSDLVRITDAPGAEVWPRWGDTPPAS